MTRPLADVIRDELRKGSYQTPGDTLPYETQANAIAAAVTAAGFGDLREAAAAGLYSVDDIWGAEGRATARLGEIRIAALSILEGEWDNHLEWNLNDIRARKARDAADTTDGRQ